MSVKAGDIVRLKSGGPLMTSGGRSGTNWTCYWFEGVRLFEGEFHEESLEWMNPKKLEAFLLNGAADSPTVIKIQESI